MSNEVKRVRNLCHMVCFTLCLAFSTCAFSFPDACEIEVNMDIDEAVALIRNAEVLDLGTFILERNFRGDGRVSHLYCAYLFLEKNVTSVDFIKDLYKKTGTNAGKIYLLWWLRFRDRDAYNEIAKLIDKDDWVWIEDRDYQIRSMLGGVDEELINILNSSNDIEPKPELGARESWAANNIIPEFIHWLMNIKFAERYCELTRTKPNEWCASWRAKVAECMRDKDEAVRMIQNATHLEDMDTNKAHTPRMRSSLFCAYMFLRTNVISVDEIKRIYRKTQSNAGKVYLLMWLRKHCEDAYNEAKKQIDKDSLVEVWISWNERYTVRMSGILKRIELEGGGVYSSSW